MEPRAHAVSPFGRPDHRRHSGERNACDPAERILEDLALELKLPRVGDVRENVAPASPVIVDVATVG
jgi:hypothetical protein